MYVCPGKHTYRVNYRYVWYVCMSGYMCNTDVYVAKECRWYLCMSKVCISGDTYIHTYKPIVSPDIHTYLSFSRSVCSLHTSFAEVSKYLAGNPCLPPPSRYVCMYVETYRRSNYGYVCMSGCESGETYIPRTL